MAEPSFILDRPRIHDRVWPPDGNASTVTTVVAPAGSGKTALLRALHGDVGARPMPNPLFVSVGECEGHVGLFIDLVIAAIRRSFPNADVGPLLALKKTVPATEYDVRLPYVLARVAERPDGKPVTLLIDDVGQLRSGEQLTEVVAGLLRSDTPALHYVLASRQTLPFDLSRFRQTGDIVELTSKELEFSPSEVRDFFQGQFGRTLNDSFAERIWQKTHGWAGALGLLAVLMQDMSEEELDVFLDGFSGKEEPLVDFVVMRLLRERRPQVQYFAKVISILDEADPEVIAAIFTGRFAEDRAPTEEHRFLIQLPEQDLPAYVRELEAAQLLAPSTSGGCSRFNPLVGATLRALLARDNPSAFREAHRRAAHWYLKTNERVSAAALDHLVEAQDFGRLLEVLEGEAERFFAAGYHRNLSRWLLELEAHYASLPFWASYYLGRVYSMLGDWDRARSYLDKCNKALPERSEAGDAWRWQPRLCLGYAGMYERRGMHTDAGTYCRRGLDILRQLQRRGGVAEEHHDEVVGLQLALLNLLGTLKLEAGSYDKAAFEFEEARRLAADEGRAVDEALALNNLGLIATRKGSIATGTEHYEDALARIDPKHDVELYATIASHLGTNQHITGRYQHAETLLRNALAIRMETGHPASIARSLSTLGELRATAGNFDAADAAFRKAARMLDAIGNLKTRAVVLDRYAAFLASQGRVYEAQTMHERAEGLIGGMLRAEAPLTALHRETAMELAAARGRMEDALAQLMVAVESYEKLGARYNVARLYWRAAGIHHRMFIGEQRATPESVVSYLELACVEANRNGYVFGPLGEMRELLLVGRSLGLPETIRYCDNMLARMGVSPDQDEVGLPESVAARYDKFQQRLEREDEFTLLTRDGRSGASEMQVEEILRTRAPRALVVLLYRQEMINFGEVTSLSQKRVILPLLIHFLRRPQGVFTMAELAEHVWNTTDLTESMKTKVKVAISRLRSLLGRSRTYVVTGRRPAKKKGSEVTYGLAPDLEYYLIEEAEPES